MTRKEAVRTVSPEKMMKKALARPSVREQKADALDAFVKGELARIKAVDAAKTAKLRALRLERDKRQSEEAGSAEAGETKPAKRKTMHLRSIR